MSVKFSMLKYAILLLCAISGCICSISFRYSDCNDRSVEAGHVDAANLNPYPIIIPGKLTANGQAHLFHNITANTQLHVQFKRHIPLIGYTTIPCVSNVGSCNYDVCKLMSETFVVNGVTTCPPQLVANNIPCTCPLKAGTYTLQSSVFEIPKLAGIWTVFASGDYHVHATVVENGVQTGCYDVQFTLDHACSGFSCIFGKK